MNLAVAILIRLGMVALLTAGSAAAAETEAGEPRSEALRFHGYALRPERRAYKPVTMHDSFVRVRGPKKRTALLDAGAGVAADAPGARSIGGGTLAARAYFETIPPVTPTEPDTSLSDALDEDVDPYERLRGQDRSRASRFTPLDPDEDKEQIDPERAAEFDPADIEQFEQEYEELRRLSMQREERSDVGREATSRFPDEWREIAYGDEMFEFNSDGRTYDHPEFELSGAAPSGGSRLMVPGHRPGPSTRDAQPGRALTPDRGWIPNVPRRTPSAGLSAPGQGGLSGARGASATWSLTDNVEKDSTPIERQPGLARPRGSERPSALRGHN